MTINSGSRLPTMLLLVLLLLLSSNVKSLFFGLGGKTSNNRPPATIVCSTRNHFAFSTVYDTVLEDKCTTKANCGQQCTIVQDTKCETRWCGVMSVKKCLRLLSRYETVYSSSCSSEKEQECTTVYDTHYQQSCQPTHVR